MDSGATASNAIANMTRRFANAPTANARCFVTSTSLLWQQARRKTQPKRKTHKMDTDSIPQDAGAACQRQACSAVAALGTLAELARPVFYRGESPCGMHLFSDCSPMVTHVFATIDEAAAVFAGRDIRNLPND